MYETYEHGALVTPPTVDVIDLTDDWGLGETLSYDFLARIRGEHSGILYTPETKGPGTCWIPLTPWALEATVIFT